LDFKEGEQLMAITATTLSAACGLTDNTVALTSVTGVTAPSFQTGAGITYLFIDQELMQVINVNTVTLIVNVKRGMNGTIQATHVVNSQVQVGLPADFAPYVEVFKNSLVVNETVAAQVKPATFLSGTADAIPAGVAGVYVIKTGSADLMTLAAPTAAQEGNVIEIWSDTNFAHTLTATSLLAGGTALKTTATFPAFRGAGLVLCVRNLVYHVLSSGNGNVASFVVLT
jgi:hypothetical protein